MNHPINPGFQPGNRWAVCDKCGFDYRVKDMKKTWDGLFVCKDDWEPRHPQDLIRPMVDNIAPVGDVRPVPEDQYITVTYAQVNEGLPSGNNNGNL